MYTFSVGTVAAIINAVVAILQFVLPNALVFALVATLSETHTAVTWSSVARSLHSSHWPLLLRSDSAATKNVHFNTTIITLLRPVALALVAIAAIVTPLGLYEEIRPSAQLRPVEFVRQPDEGPFGSLTPPRSSLGFSRDCTDEGGFLPAQCPGTTTVITYANNGSHFNATVVNDDYDRRIPVQLAELYQSGLSSQPGSMSSFFDVEWRWYNEHKRDNIRNQSYSVDSYHPIASVIGDGDIKLVEGLIVDVRNGEIGFRSHTTPSAAEVPYGAEWDEDILFFQPETACIDTNLTLEYVVPSEFESVYATPKQNIVDRGGFAQISRHIPWDDGWYGDTQQDPKLGDRAYRAAWTTNVLNMYYFGVTRPFTNFTAPINSHIGKKFAVNNSLADSYSEQSSGLMSLAVLSYDGLIDSSGLSESHWNNPFDIDNSNWTAADDGCKGYIGGDWANMTNIQVKCGLVLGPANKTAGSDTMLVEPGSNWMRPIHMCASTTKATIKTVRFAYNQTRGRGLDALAVTSLTDKHYADKEQMPIWAVETPNMTLGAIKPFWGLISPLMQSSTNLSTVQSDHLYIPASSSVIYKSLLSVDGGTSYMPGTSAPAILWESAYTPEDLRGNTLQDLSGRTSLALAARWKNMTTSPEGTAGVMDLIRTDLAANALIGTRGWLSGGEDTLPPNLMSSTTLLRKRDSGISPSKRTGRVPVHVHQRVVRYNWIYGIPAFLSLLLAAIICAAALVAVVSGKGSMERIRFHLNHLSAGRLLMALRLGKSNFGSRAKEWVEGDGRQLVGLPGVEDDEDSHSMQAETLMVEPKRR